MDFLTTDRAWAEADVRFFNKLEPGGIRKPRYHQVAFADTYQVSALTVFSRDWKTSVCLSPDCWSSTWSRHGHNWFGVTRLDFGICPPAIPYYFSGHLVTGGMNSTFSVRRLKTIHRLTSKIPAKANFTLLDSGVWHALWSERKQTKESFCISACRSWHFGSSPEDAIKRAILARFQAVA